MLRLLFIYRLAPWQASPILSTFAKGKIAASTLYNIIDRKPDIDVDETVGLVPEKMQGAVEFRDVSFVYPARPDVQVLRRDPRR